MINAFTKWISLIIGSSLLLLSACIEESLYSGSNSEEGKPVTLKIYINVPNQQVVQTRSTVSDDYINPDGVYILVFDSEQKFVEINQAMSTSSSGKGEYYANLTATSSSRNVYLVANASNIINAKKGKWTSATTLDEIKKDLLKAPLKQVNGVITQMPEPQPMVGSISFPEGYSSKSSIGAKDAPVIMTRATSKVKVIYPEMVDVLGANLAQVPLQGYVFPDPPSPAAISTGNYGSEEEGMEGMLGISRNEGIEMYCYESPVKNGTCVILKASYNNIVGYYRITITDKDSGSELDLKRNYEYRITISNIKSAGYSTAAEALAAPPSKNIVYEVEVIDSNSYDIMSNGEYYLGVSNSNFVLYSTQNITDELVAIITHNAPSGVTGKITYTSVGGTISVQDPFAGDGTGAPQTCYLRMSMPQSVTSATINLQLGNLIKTITVTRISKDIRDIGEVIDLFTSKEYVVGDVSDEAEGWIKLSTSAETSRNSTKNLICPDGGIYVHFTGNIGFGTELGDRNGSIYLARSDDKGRSKITFHQKNLNIYTEKVQIEPFTYIATFHRWYQTGERIIRVQPKDATNNSYWRAIVAVGQEWIELSAARSPDTGLGTDPYGAGDNSNWTDQDIENNAQLLTDSITVIGSGKLIYFRIGLKDQLPGGANGTPRYGLVVIEHQKGNHFIFVRQGEQADFLMREIDPITRDPLKPAQNTTLMATRPSAAKFSPYNLTAPGDTENSIKLPVGTQAVFTEYPSMGGFLYRPYTRWLYPATGSISQSDWNAGGSFDANWDIFPPDYRLPNDGPSENSKGDIENSEVRQSLWLYPSNGIASSNFQNMVTGYIADGYYDRKEMRMANEGSNPYTKVPTIVGYNNKMAYAGTLLFNPYNFASIFLPSCGTRGTGGSGTSSTLTGAGSNSIHPTSSKQSSNLAWSVDIGYYPASSGSEYVFDNYSSNFYYAQSPRCVEKPAPSRRATKYNIRR